MNRSLLPFRRRNVARLVGELAAWRERIDSKGPLPRTWTGRLRRDLEAEAVAASTAMEGVPVTVDEVRRILAGQRVGEVRDEDRRLVEGYRDAMGFVLRRADDAGFTWDRGLIVNIHDRVMASRWDLGAGQLRRGQVDVRRGGALVFEPPRAMQVPALVDQVCTVLAADTMHPAEAAAWVHVAVAAIHPFRDGNGRTSRILAALAMYRGGNRRLELTSLEEWWGAHRDEYYAAFTCLGPRFAARADVTPFVEAHLAAQLSQVRALDLREEVQHRIWTSLENIVEQLGLNRRVANAAWEAFFGRPLTAGYYREVTDVSVSVATMDLTAARAGGLLRSQGERRARRYLSGERLHDLVAGQVGVDLRGAADQDAARRIVDTLARRVLDARKAT